MLKSKNDRWLMLIALVTSLVSSIYAIVMKRSYSFDGVNFFASVYNWHDVHLLHIYNEWGHLRIGPNFLNQLLLVIGLDFGIENITIAQILFAIPLFMYKYIAIYFMYKVLDSERKNMVIYPVAAFAFFYILSEIFVLNQSVMAAWVYWTAFFFITKKEKVNGKLQYAILALTIIMLPFSHETIIPVAPLLMIITLDEYFVRKNRVNALLLKFLMTEIPFAFALNLYWLKTHKRSTGTSYWTNFIKLLMEGSFKKTNLTISIICFVGYFICILFLKKFNKATWVVAATSGSFVIYLIVNGLHLPKLEYQLRCLITLGTFGAILVCYIAMLLEGKKEIALLKATNIFRITMVVLLMQSVWQIYNTLGWTSFIKEFDMMLESNTGYIEDATIDNVYSCFWTQPHLSLVEAEDFQNITTVVVPYSDTIVIKEIDGRLYFPSMKEPIHEGVFKINIGKSDLIYYQ